MLLSRASRLLGHYEYEVILPPSKVSSNRKKSYIIQTNLNTTFQQILDEVCASSGYNPKDYELIYEGTKLDRDVTIRKSGLPVNGVLDLVSGANVQKETSVNVGLQLESGKRLAHKFDVQETLWNVLQHWQAQGEKILEDESSEESKAVPVCNYLRQTIIGKEQLEGTTLRSIGLTRGSGVIRLNFRALNEVGSQAGISAQVSYPVKPSPLPTPTPATPVEERMEVERASEASSNQVVPEKILENRIKSVEVPRKELPEAPAPIPPVSQAGSRNKSVEKERKGTEAMETVAVEAVQEDDPMNSLTGELRYATEGALFVLGDNKGVIYHGDDVRPPKVEAEPDDFFEITQKDVESIYRELRAKRAQLENQPLLTSSLRKTDQELMDEQVVNKYPATVVRIRFPDRFVLQGVFPTTDYVSSVTAFVQRHLQNPELNFYLFKAPPKTLLDGAKTLLQENLLGLAIIYFGSDSRQERYFKEELFSKVSDPQEVFKNSKSLADYSGPQNQTPREGGAEMVVRREPVETVPKAAQEPKADGQPTTSASRPTRTTNSGVVPKWFKASK